MERHLALNKNELAGKIPEIEKSLNVIEALVKKQVRAPGGCSRWTFSPVPALATPDRASACGSTGRRLDACTGQWTVVVIVSVCAVVHCAV